MVRISPRRELGNMEIPPFDRNVALLQSLPVPFWEVTIAREMRQFGSALGLEPNHPGTPSGNIASAILSGRTSFKSILRHELGDTCFRNLQNFATGKVKTPRTLAHVLAKCGGSQEMVRLLAEVLRDADSSGLVRMVTAFEGAAYRSMRFIRSSPLPCRCCGKNMILSSEQWWGMQDCDIGAPESAFIDRVCMVALALHYLITLRSKSEHRPAPRLVQLADDSAHPYKNWLTIIADLYNAPDLAHLAVRAAADLDTDTVWRYARGEALPDAAIEKLTENLTHAGSIQLSALSARILALAIEFLRAANREVPLDDATARQLVSKRVKTMLNEVIALVWSAHRAPDTTKDPLPA